MKTLGVVVEGKTEEAFVRNVLGEYLQSYQLEVAPTIIGSANSRGDGGGNVNIDGLARDMVISSWDNDFVTSLVDFYGFIGKGEMTVDQLENQIALSIQERVPDHPNFDKFIPYVQMHEFEGLLFSDTSAFAEIDASEDSILQLEQIRNSFPTPEDINDNSATAPSKRLEKLLLRYHKPRHGNIVAEAIGIDTIRSKCRRFDVWLRKLESLGS